MMIRGPKGQVVEFIDIEMSRRNWIGVGRTPCGELGFCRLHV